MYYNNLNNKGLHSMRMKQFMQQGGQTEEAVIGESPMDQLIPAIKAALEQGKQLIEIISVLAQNQVPIEAIGQALVQSGVPEDEVVSAFQQIQSQQQQMEQQMGSMEEPVAPMPQQGAPQQMPPQQMPPEAMAPQGMPMAQRGFEKRKYTKGNIRNKRRSDKVGMEEEVVNQEPLIYPLSEDNSVPTSIVNPLAPFVEDSIQQMPIPVNNPVNNMMSETVEPVEPTAPVETLVTNKDNKYDYKQVVNPDGTTQYYYKNKKSKDWTAAEEGSQNLKAIKASVFDTDKDEWYGTEEEKEWTAGQKKQYNKKKKDEELGLDKLKKGEYAVEVITYPYGSNTPGMYGTMEPGHAEARIISDNLPDNLKSMIDSDEYQGHINWWFDGNRNVTYDPEKHYQHGTRTAVIKLTEAELENFIKESANITPTEGGPGDYIAPAAKGINLFLDAMDAKGLNSLSKYHIDEDAAGKTIIPLGEEGYNFLNNNCAQGVCNALGITDPSVKNLGTADPNRLMDYLTTSPEWKDKILSQTGQGILPEESDLVKGKDKESWKKIIELQKFAEKEGFDMSTLDADGKIPMSIVKKAIDIFADDLGDKTNDWFNKDDLWKLLRNTPEIGLSDLNKIMTAMSTGSWRETVGTLDDVIDLQAVVSEVPGAVFDKLRDKAGESLKNQAKEDVSWGNFYYQIPAETANLVREGSNAVTDALDEHTYINLNQDFTDAMRSVPEYWSRYGWSGLWPFRREGGESGKYSDIFNVQEIAPAYSDLDDLYNEYSDYEGDEVGAWRSGVNNPMAVGRINEDAFNRYIASRPRNTSYVIPEYDTMIETPKFGFIDKFRENRQLRRRERRNKKNVPSFDSAMNYMQGGGDLPKAQLGIGNFQNFNQFYGQDDSFRSNINSAYMPMNLGMRGNVLGAVANVAEAGSRLLSGKDRDGDGLADGVFRDTKAKRNRHKAMRQLSKGKTPEGFENWQDKTMLKYNPETMQYDMGFNDPRYQSKLKKWDLGNIFKKGEKVRTDEYKLRPSYEGYTSLSKFTDDYKNLSEDQQKIYMNVAHGITDFKTEKNKPSGVQFGVDEKGGIGYYDKDATLPEGSQERINNIMMMQNYGKGGSYKKLRRLPKNQDGPGTDKGASLPFLYNTFMQVADMEPREVFVEGQGNVNEAVASLVGNKRYENYLKELDQYMNEAGVPISLNQTPAQAWDNTVSWWKDALGLKEGGQPKRLRRAQTGLGMMAPAAQDNTRVDNTDQMAQLNALMDEVRRANQSQSKYRVESPHDNPANDPALSDLRSMFEKYMSKGLSPEEAQAQMYNSGMIPETEYEAVQGLKEMYKTQITMSKLMDALLELVNQGLHPLDAQAQMLNSGMVKETDYDAFKGLVNNLLNQNMPNINQNMTAPGQGSPMQMQPNQIKKVGGDFDMNKSAPSEIELTTEQVAQIMAAGGSVKIL